MKATQSFLCAWGRRRSHRGSAAGHRCAGTQWPQEPTAPACCLLNALFPPNASNAHGPSDHTEVFPLCSQTPLIYWNQMHLFLQELPGTYQAGYLPAITEVADPLWITLCQKWVNAVFSPPAALSRHLLLSAASIALRVRTRHAANFAHLAGLCLMSGCRLVLWINSVFSFVHGSGVCLFVYFKHECASLFPPSSLFGGEFLAFSTALKWWTPF